ncbi:MAG: hypothetical protein EAZ91_21090 [Cytophagales bacterium]|nr:MAG: hypothetical protein EAZ91_21090 [Cytophagales bacterium]
MPAKSTIKGKPYLFKKIKMYSAEEIIAAGGTTSFGKITHYDSEKLLTIKGNSLTEEEYKQALALISK